MTNIFFSGRIPQELHDHVVNFCEAEGKSKTDILRESLAQYTNFELNSKKDQINSLPWNQTVNELRDKILELTDIINSHEKRIEEIAGLLIINNRKTDNRTDNDDITVIKTTDIISAENTDNTTDNTDIISNKETFTQLELTEPVVTKSYKWNPIPETQMAKLTGIDRTVFRKLRSQIDRGLKVEPIDTVIDGISCKVRYSGEKNKELKQSPKLWIAIPNV
jgi:hypothetical protein